MPRKIEQTASPQRNFTLTTAERVGAIVTGLPAWARRLKRIEELGPEIVRAHEAGRTRESKQRLAEMVKLIEAHNAYYPIEANLPLDPETSRMMDQGEPWRPMPKPTLESILDAAKHRENEALEPNALVWSDTPEALTLTFDGKGATFLLRLDDAALVCKSEGEELVRVATSTIEEFVAAEVLEVVTWDAETVRFPFALDADAVSELSSRLRTIRASASDYRGDAIE